MSSEFSSRHGRDSARPSIRAIVSELAQSEKYTHNLDARKRVPPKGHASACSDCRQDRSYQFLIHFVWIVPAAPSETLHKSKVGL